MDLSKKILNYEDRDRENEDTKELKRKHLLSLHLFLVKNLDPEPLLDELYANEIITQYNIELIKSKPVRWDRARDIMMLIPKRGPKAYDVFCDAVERTQLLYISEKVLEGRIK